MDELKIDSHKLQYHPKRVSQFLDASGNPEKLKKIFPIYVEISPVGACNHRCTFCSVDYIGYKPVLLSLEHLKEVADDFKKNDVKSVMFAGEGEPFVHKKITEAVEYFGKNSIDVSFTTNGTVIPEKFYGEALDYVSWIKVSVNGGEHSYQLIHGSKDNDFEKVFQNLRRLSDERDKRNLALKVGVQMVLLPQNSDEVLPLAKKVKSSGCNYFVVKPFSQHKSSINRDFEKLDYTQFMDLEKSLEALNDENFTVVFRSNAMSKKGEEAPAYTKCYSTPNFWAYIMASGDVYSCSAYLLDERFKLGNIGEKSFADIWQSEERATHCRFMANELDIKECRENCRMDEVNRYLSNLVNDDVEHVNFI